MSAFDKIFGFDLLDGRYSTSDRYDDTLQQIVTHRLAEYYHRAKRLLAEKRYLISDDFKRIKADCAA